MPTPKTVEILKSGWYDQQETMDRLKLAERTLREWVKDGRIKTKANPANTRQRLYKADDVDRLAEEGPAIAQRRPSPPRETTAIAKPQLGVLEMLQVLETSRRERETKREDEIRAEIEKRVRAELEETRPWLTLEQAIERTGQTEAQLRHAIKAGAIVATKRGGIRILRASLEEYRG